MLRNIHVGAVFLSCLIISDKALADIAVSCAAIKTADPQSQTGVYTIDPDGNGTLLPFPVFCDMDDHDGSSGWTLIMDSNGQGIQSQINDPKLLAQPAGSRDASMQGANLGVLRIQALAAVSKRVHLCNRRMRVPPQVNLPEGQIDISITSITSLPLDNLRHMRALNAFDSNEPFASDDDRFHASVNSIRTHWIGHGLLASNLVHVCDIEPFGSGYRTGGFPSWVSCGNLYGPHLAAGGYMGGSAWIPYSELYSDVADLEVSLH